MTIFLDTCFSGSTRENDVISRKVCFNCTKRFVIPDNFLIFSAKVLRDVIPLDEVKHGIFSYYLMKGMEGYVDKNKDNKISSGELNSYIQENVLKQTSCSEARFGWKF